MKKCIECGVVKTDEEFWKNERAKDGLRDKCKECWRPYYKEYFKRPERIEKSRASVNAFYARRTKENRVELMAKIRARRESEPNHALGKAIRRGIKRHPTDNPASVKELLEMFREQDGCCAVSGVKMTWAKGWYTPTSISLDRIDPKRGYSIDNIRLVCYQVNVFRGMWSDAQMLAMARAIVAKAEPPYVPLKRIYPMAERDWIALGLNKPPVFSS